MKNIASNFEEILPRENPIVMLHAHADDESFLSAGIILELISRGYKLLLIYLATGLVENEEKTKIRQNELRNACKVLGVSEVIFLRYCEPKYEAMGEPLHVQNIDQVADDIRESLSVNNIDTCTLFSYDKNGGYGNIDHIFLHKVGRKLIQTRSDSIKLFEVTICRDLFQSWFSKNKKTHDENYLPKIRYWSDNFGLKYDEIDFAFQLTSEQVNQKREAMKKHISQIRNDEFPLILSDDDFNTLFGKEYFAE